MMTSSARTGADRMAHVRPTSRDAWYGAAAGFADFGYRHAWDFNVLAADRQGTVAEHVEIVDGTERVGLACVRIKALPLIGGIAYVGGGPLTRQGGPGDLDHLEVSLRALRAEYVGSRHLVLRVSPPVTEPDRRDDYEAVYRGCGYEPAPDAAIYRTLVLDLAPPLDEIRAGLKKNWRRDLNRSERSGFSSEIGTSTEMFARFRELFETFIDWKDFEVEHDARFHEQVHAALPESARYLVVLSHHEGELAGGLIVARTGDTAVYVLGASNPELRKLSPGHFLQWQAIEHLRTAGLRWYDLGGIDPEDNPGGHHFKSGISKVEAMAPGPFEMRPGRVRAGLVDAAELAYAGLKRLRSR